MDIDVILPTYNRCDLLPRAIDSFLEAIEPGGITTTLIVVDNNSRDGTKAVVESYLARHPDRIRYLFEIRQGKHYALNTGISQSSADVIAFFDDDETMDHNWLVTIARNFDDPVVDYIGGEVRPDWQAMIPDWFPTGYTGVVGIIQNGDQRRQYGSPGFKAMLTGGNSAIRRRVLEECGPYSSEYMYAEDLYMQIQLNKIGATGFYEPDLVISHHIPKKRLTKAYYRHWAVTEGRTMGKVALGMPVETRSIFGIPLWMWRVAAESVCGSIYRLGRKTTWSALPVRTAVVPVLGLYRGSDFTTSRTLQRSDNLHLIYTYIV